MHKWRFPEWSGWVERGFIVAKNFFTTLHYNLIEFYGSGLYYKSFTIIIKERNAIGQYYKTTIVVNANYDRS